MGCLWLTLWRGGLFLLDALFCLGLIWFDLEMGWVGGRCEQGGAQTAPSFALSVAVYAPPYSHLLEAYLLGLI